MRSAGHLGRAYGLRVALWLTSGVAGAIIFWLVQMMAGGSTIPAFVGEQISAAGGYPAAFGAAIGWAVHLGVSLSYALLFAIIVLAVRSLPFSPRAVVTLIAALVLAGVTTMIAPPAIIAPAETSAERRGRALSDRRVAHGRRRGVFRDLRRACPNSAWCWLAIVLALVVAASASAHEGEHGDPELLNHWRAQVHLLFQWAHLVAFGLWVGGTLAARRVPLGLQSLLFGSWGLFLVSLGTGGYNMEFSAATPEPPDIFSLPALSRRWEFGDAYIVLVGAKQALFVLAALWTAAITAGHLRLPPERDRTRLRQVFIAGSTTLGLLLAGVTAMVLVLHEAVDLAPTPLHSLGGVVARKGGDELGAARAATRTAPPPYGTDTRDVRAGFRLFAVPRAAGDALARFGHLVGFALWLGASAVGLLGRAADARRSVPLLWLALAVQFVTGAYQMVSWTPFSVAPYPWRLSVMGEFRFGYTYTFVLTLKLALAALALLGAIALTAAARGDVTAARRSRWVRALQVFDLAVGLALAYVAVTLLLVHEGVDHAL